MLDPEWARAEKKVDPEFAGSPYEQLGFQPLLCPTCGAHLHDDICLNACHLTQASQERFGAAMRSITTAFGIPPDMLGPDPHPNATNAKATERRYRGR